MAANIGAATPLLPASPFMCRCVPAWPVAACWPARLAGGTSRQLQAIARPAKPARAACALPRPGGQLQLEGPGGRVLGGGHHMTLGGGARDTCAAASEGGGLCR